MKKLQIKFFMVALAFATILVGCKPEPIEQSSVNINDFKETATITGTLQYDEGQGFDGTKYTRLVKPAAEVTVTAIIANSEYSATTTGSGNITYNTKTDANGNYSITVPVTSKGVSVRIKATNFTGQYHRIIDVKNGAPVYKDVDGVYTLEEETFKLEKKLNALLHLTHLIPQEREGVEGCLLVTHRLGNEGVDKQFNVAGVYEKQAYGFSLGTVFGSVDMQVAAQSGGRILERCDLLCALGIVVLRNGGIGRFFAFQIAVSDRQSHTSQVREGNRLLLTEGGVEILPAQGLVGGISIKLRSGENIVGKTCREVGALCSACEHSVKTA
jgi:hypothetical protein